MKDRKTSIIFILIILALLFALWIIVFFPKPLPPNNPTQTPKPSITASITPSLTFTPIVSPTPTISPQIETPTPTIEPTTITTSTVVPVNTPQIVVVRTGYEPGWLNFRPGAGLSYVSRDYLYEGQELEFIACEYAPYPWARIKYGSVIGYSYSPFLFPDPCSK